MEKKVKEVDWDYKRKVNDNRHTTYQILGVTFAISAFMISIVWATCIYNLERVKHPVDYNKNVEINTNYERK